MADVLSALPSCPIPAVARLTQPCWKSASLAYFDTSASNGSTEAIDGVIETTRRVARDSASSRTTDSDAYSQQMGIAGTGGNHSPIPSGS